MHIENFIILRTFEESIFNNNMKILLSKPYINKIYSDMAGINSKNDITRSTFFKSNLIILTYKNKFKILKNRYGKDLIAMKDIKFLIIKAKVNSLS